MSQSGIYIPTSGPGSGTVTSISAGTGITLTPNPITTTGTVALTIPVVVADGGTGAITLAGLLLGNGTSAVTGITPGDYGVLISSSSGVPSWLANGTTGQVLTATTSGTPSWENAAASSITITGDSGGGLTGNSFTFTGGTTGLTFAGASSTETLGGTLVVGNGGTGAVTLTGLLLGHGTSAVTAVTAGDYGVLISSSAGVPSWLANGTTGQILTATTSGTPSWENVAASSITITGDSGGGLTGASFTFTGGTTGLTFAGAGSTETLGGTLAVKNGGTGAATLTGVLIGNGTSAVTGNAVTQYDVLVGGASNAISSVGPGTALQVLQSGGNAANPVYSTATYPATTTINQLLYSSSNNVIGGVTAGDYGVLISSSAGVPSWLANGTTGQILTATTSGTPSWENAASGGITTIDGDSGSVTGSTITITGGTSGAVFTGSSTTLTESFNFLALPTSSATAGYISIGGSQFLTAGPNGVGGQCILIGQGAGNTSLTSSANIGIGFHALHGLTGGSGNVALGTDTMVALAGGSYNVGMGYYVGANLSSGQANTFLGSYTGCNAGTSAGVTTGSYNVCIGCINDSSGYGAGYLYTGSESSNILIQSPGVVGESNVIRIGTNGSGTAQQSSCYIAGIAGVSVGSVATVVTEASNQLGTAVLTAGTGITITPTANVITIASTGGGSISLTGDTGGALSSSSFVIKTGLSGNNSGSTFKVAGSGVTLTIDVCDASGNMAIGQLAGSSGSSGNSNTALGYACYNTSSTGSSNTYVGNSVANAQTSGGNNVAVGTNALTLLLTGENNCCIGANAGINYTSSESSNILINNGGVVSESSITRIGATGSQSACYISGIHGVTVTGTAVLVSSTDQLGIAVSSRRYKENIEDMDDISDPILDLRPVTFNYTVGEDHSQQVGLIAEEVNEIMPALVVLDKEGLPQTVKYHELPVLLLNELQKAICRIEMLEDELADLKDAMEDLVDGE